jgi:thiosulfate/3-mercaptopyruvate sulfurtransferase
VAATLPQLVDVETLRAQIGDPTLRIIDSTVRSWRTPDGGGYLSESGRGAYEQAHIPGATFADILLELSDPESPLPYTLPSTERFASTLGRLGVGPGTHVVAYAQESPVWATRLWWLLRFFGFDDVSVLDGGLTAWRAAGYELSVGPSGYPPATFPATRQPQLLATRDDVETAIGRGDHDLCLINALSPAVFRGEDAAGYARPGRLPGSVNVPYTDIIESESTRFKPVPEIRQRLELAEALDRPAVIAYCGGGISATADVFALSLLGRSDVKLYDGSLSEWAMHPALPLEVG